MEKVDLLNVLDDLEDIRDRCIDLSRLSGIIRSLALEELSERVRVVLQNLHSGPGIEIEETPNFAEQMLFSNLRILQNYIERLRHLMRPDEGLADVELMRNLEQTALWESLVHYVLDETIYKLSQQQADRSSSAPNVSSLTHFVVEAHQFSLDARARLLPEIVIPRVSDLEDCYESMLLCKNALRRYQRSVGREDSIITSRLGLLLGEPTLGDVGHMTSIYTLIRLTCNLHNYVILKEKWLLTHTERLRDDYRAISWRVELGLGLDKLTVVLASLLQSATEGDGAP